MYMIKNILLHILNILLNMLLRTPLDLRCQGQPKRAPKGACFHQGSPNGIRENQLEN